MPNVSSIKTAGEVVTNWMYRNSSISVSIILNGLQTRKITSTGLRISARRPSAIYASLMVFQRSILGFFEGIMSGVLTTQNRKLN